MKSQRVRACVRGEQQERLNNSNAFNTCHGVPHLFPLPYMFNETGRFMTIIKADTFLVCVANLCQVLLLLLFL